MNRRGVSSRGGSQKGGRVGLGELSWGAGWDGVVSEGGHVTVWWLRDIDRGVDRGGVGAAAV